MIICLIGTRAQLIKMAPVLARLEAQEVPYRLVLTGQHQETMQALLAEFGLQAKPLRLGDGPEITGVARLAGWFLAMLWRGMFVRRAWFRAPSGVRSCIVVHGDTASTLLGALLGRWHGLRVVHVESGLSSGNWREPFPEELIRRLVFRLADIACCPGPEALAHLAGRALRLVDTGRNTILDAVGIAQARFPSVTLPVLPERYAVISLHRFENIFDRARFEHLLDALTRAAQRLPLVFVLHPSTRRQAERFGLLPRLAATSGLTLLPRMTYVPFLKLAAAAAAVVTDGGSNQEELAFLGVPVLLMRGVTERADGLGQGVEFADSTPGTIAAFLARVLAGRSQRAQGALPDPAPSSVVATLLADEFA